MNKDDIKRYCKNSILLNRIVAIVYRLAGGSVYFKRNNNELNADLAYLWKVRFNIQGKNNLIVMKRGVRIKNTTINIYGDNNILILDDYVRIHNSAFVLHQDHCKIQIGKYSSAERALFAAVEHNSEINIGEDCMISTDVELRTSDSHKIYSFDRVRINPKRDISVGNHVWIGAHANVLKGVTLHDGSIVGFGSIVTKDVPERCIAAGNPASVIKKDVLWER